MDLSAPIEVFLSRHSELPHELHRALQDSYVNLPALAAVALDRRWTTTLLQYFGPVFADVCSRWSHSDEFAAGLAAYGRVIPFAPHLAEYAARFLRRHARTLRELWAVVQQDNLVEVLLAIFRLLVADADLFRRHFDLNVLNGGLKHGSRSVRYLTIRILSLHLQAADATTEDLLRQYLSPGPVEGEWEDKTVDYTFLSLWEEQWWKDVENGRDTIASSIAVRASPSRQREVRREDLSPSTICIFGNLMPRLDETSASRSSNDLIPVTSTIRNVRQFTNALLRESPILLTGLAGAGKTSIVSYCAQNLNKHESMVTLHLNEQSDAKMLVGMYTSGTTPGTFVWQAGVLTTAVREGRWLFIEDLDRAPNEIISVLLPLIERKELLIPSRGETIKAAHGFRIIATMRTVRDLSGRENLVKRSMIGSRFWNRVSVGMLTQEELKEVIFGRFKALQSHAEQLTSVFTALQNLAQNGRHATQLKTGSARPLTPRDLFKWCQRLDRQLARHTSFSEAQLDEMFLEAVDCFAGHLAQGDIFGLLAATIAQELHIDAARRDHLIQSRVIKLSSGTKSISIGRTKLKQISKTRGPQRQQSFAHAPHTLRLLEKLAVAVDNKEPLLLVGETGIGKTTCIQQLAVTMGQKLVSFNLSQQSESGDLLGGFKPVNVRGLIMPLSEEFDELFNHPFSPFAKRKEDNQHFVDMLGKAMAKGQWKKVCLMWKSAASEVQKSLAKATVPKSSARSTEGQHPSKKRRTGDISTASEDESHAFYETRWNKFAADIGDLEGHLASKTNAFAFKFVEGNLVKAVRNGHWVLLDEINLATPDTLEALVDLLSSSFGETPSLLLTESGNIERISAHPDFRVFAAMNPATDIGKKDLPPGVRSRFTELYVDSPDRDIKSLQYIVASYLPDELGPRLIADVTNLYVDIQTMAEANMLVDGAGQKPHFSLRTLSRTLVYARDVAAAVGAKDGIYRRALYEGFHMSFLTFLDSTSEALVGPKIVQHLFAKHSNSKAELSKPLPKPADGRTYVQEGHYWLHKGVFEPQKQLHYIITPFVQRNLNNLIRAISTKKLPILIQGPTSSGKTSMVEYLAKKSGNKFVRINNHEHTDLQEYLGTYVSDTDGQLRFQEGILVEALRKGYWIVLDELNLAPTDVLEALNRLLDDNRELLIPETQEIVTPHEDFMLFATQNPAGLYGGRKHLSRAFRNRFLELHFDDIPVNELCDILQQRTQIPPSWAQRIVDTYKELSSLRQENRMFEQKSFATLRDLFRWALRRADDKQSLAINGYMLLGERVRKPEEREKVRQVIEEVMSRAGPKVKIDESVLYDAASSQDITVYQANAPDGKGVVWTKSMRRLYVLVANAIRNNEPVLLVGETGCGKTTVCQMLADALSKDLFIVNAHQNTETGDLIGSQRPVRNRTAVEQRLVQCLRQALPGESHSSTLAELWSVFEMLPAESRASLPVDMHEEILALRAKSQALFEWSDGSLVHAMKTGQLFLLDEISLADDSVLERLNSVLEPGRTLLLAEKGAAADASVTAIDGFQFLATMNPGGDYGKRELSPALRNRFTEIWVPSLYDLDDILEIVRAKLVSEAFDLAEAIVRFSSWFNERYNSSAASAISIRDTLAWIEFVNKFSKEDVVLAVLQGAAMVYIDTLGANPAAMLSISMATIDEERRKCVAELSRLLQRDLGAEYFSIPELVAGQGVLSLGTFTLPRAIDGIQDTSFTFSAATTRINTMRVFRALQLLKPLLIEGNPGVGKTTLVTAIAKAVGKRLVRINLSEQTDLMDLFGSDVPVEGSAVGTFAWRDAPFLSAMKNGDWVLLDEMNLASQSVLEGLNACLDHRAEAYIAELDQTFHRHPNFRLFAAQNPHHQGGGRKGLPASFVNRFTVVYADVFKQDDLNLICKQVFPSVPEEKIAALTRFVDKLETDVVQRHRYGALGSPWEFNLRDTMRWLQLQTKSDGLLAAGEAHDFCDIVVRQRFRTTADREHLDKAFAEAFQTAISHRNFYHNLSSDSYQVGLGLIQRGSITGSASPRLPPFPVSQLPSLEALMICVEYNWPVLLTGASGSGKSRLLNHLAAIAGRRLLTFSMNADIDAMDLVGGYEQADPSRKRAELMAHLVALLRSLVLTASKHEPSAAEKLLQAIPGGVWNGHLGTDDIRSLIVSLEMANAPVFGEVLTLLHTLIELPEQIEKAQFEWVDGLLVRALQRGDWLVLDNANLCSSSVLDRLNSLLEPNGYLSINEHPTENGEPRIVKPHPGFRIFFTMDPRNGELSRAMRNRSIELFLMHIAAGGDDRTPRVFGLQASMSRYRNLLCLDRLPAIEYAADHLSYEDLSVHQSFVNQLQNGLVSEPESQKRAVEALALIAKLDSTWVSRVMKSNTSSLVALSSGAKQSIHPLNNEIVVRYNSTSLSSSSLSDSVALAKLYDALLDLQKMDTAFVEAAAVASERRPVTPFERSIRQKSFHGGRLEDTIRVAPFLKALLKMTMEFVKALLIQNGSFPETTFEALTAIRCFWWDLFGIVTSAIPDNAAYHVHIELGQKTLGSSDSTDEFTSALIKGCHNLLRELRIGTCLTTGLHMELLWQHFRPQLVPTIDRLTSFHQLRSLAGRFDTLVYPLRTSLAEVARTREYLQYALRASLIEDVDVDALIEQISESIATLGEPQNALAKTAIFKTQFEAIYQYLRRSDSDMTKSQLALLASRQTANSHDLTIGTMQSTSLQASLARLSSFASDLMAQMTPSAIRGGLSASIMDQMRVTGDVPLSELAQLRVELETIGKAMASNAHILCNDQRQAISDELRMHLEACKRESLPVEDVSAHINPGSGDYDLGRNLIKYAASCLLAYVPDRAFDPALKEQIQRTMIIARRNAHADKLRALREFEIFFSGRDESMRVALALDELHKIGEDKPELRIARPERTQLNELQGDFTRVIEIVRHVQVQSSRGHFEVDDSMMQNIVLLVKRLAEHYLPYRDLVIPAVQWLECLWLGLVLNQLSKDEAGASSGSSLWSTIHAVATAKNVQQIPPNIGTLDGMRYIALAHQIDPLRGPTIEMASTFFEDLFESWKDKVGEEQTKQAKKSSLYVYRGGQDEEEQVDEEEYAELFPDFENSDDSTREAREVSVTRETAIRVATLHGDIFLPHTDPAAYLMDLIRQRHGQQANKATVEADAMATTLPTIFVALQSKLDLVNATTIKKDNYNIYQDSNVPEATRLAAIVRKILAKYKEIHAMDFEHATVDDVIGLAEEVLSFAHTEPVAKFLTKTEKLYASMYEWEKVAHKGLSAASILAELTDLLVSWRRLELSTWMQLFAIEQQKAENDAKSWWFIAYENVVANPQRLSKEDITLHAAELLKAMELFFRNASLGQFHQRLLILRQFESHLQTQAENDEKLRALHPALNNFISYFNRFEKPVADSLSAQRRTLEKQAEEIVQLASWRDTNIEALKQSAQTSHRKLFKLIRKFRAVLNQPVAGIIDLGPPEDCVPTSRSASTFGNTLSKDTLERVTALCENLSSWSGIPSRFRNFGSTTRLMQKLGSIPEHLGAVEYIDDFLDNLHNSMKELQKATPSLLTSENKDVVKHLKTRKRGLFAEVLKKMRQMGFQYNLSSTILAKQDSTAAVLAGLPVAKAEWSGIQASEYHLHKLLSLMPKVREVQREHSGDLTPAEVQRSVGYLEGMLQHVFNQRRTLLSVVDHCGDISSASESLYHLWVSNASQPVSIVANPAIDAFDSMKAQLSWLAPILTIAQRIVSLQAKLGGVSSDHIQMELDTFIIYVEKAHTDMDLLPKLPSSILVDAHDEVYQRGQDLLTDFQSKLTLWAGQDSTFAPVLALLTPWVGTGGLTDHVTTSLGQEEHRSSSDISSIILRSLDAMLASVQGLEGAWDDLGQPGETGGWIIAYNSRLSTNIKSLNPTSALDHVQKCFRNLAALPMEERSSAIPLLLLLQPVVDTYAKIVHEYASHFDRLHTRTCRMTHELARSFVELGTKGFCTPPDKSAGEGETGKEQKLEGGTGLGEGEGAEDISKDIADDEDLTELAQESNQKKEGDELEDEKDAVDMADEDMEGEIGEAAEKEANDEGEESDHNDEGDEPEEEMGSVDDLGPEAVDEKMWDEGGKVDEGGKEKQSEQSKGQQNDDQVATEGERKEAGEAEEEDEQAEQGAQENEALDQEQEQGEQVDDYTKEGEKLDLPDDMNMDGSAGDKSDDESMGDLDDMDDDQPLEEADMPDAMRDAQEEGGESDIDERDADDAENEDANHEDNELQNDEDPDKLSNEEDQDPQIDNTLQGQDRDAKTAEDAVSSEVQGVGTDANDENTDKSAFNSRSRQEQGEQGEDAEDSGGASGDKGSNIDRNQEAVGRTEDLVEADEAQPFKQLGDALEKWFNQNRQIRRPESSDDNTTKEQKRDVDMADADFEHLLNEESQAEAQALGTATEDQARALNEDNAISANEQELPQKSFVDEDDEPDAGYQTADDVQMEDAGEDHDHQRAEDGIAGQTKAFIGDSRQQYLEDGSEDMRDESTDHEDGQAQLSPSPDIISDELRAVSISNTDARALWTQNELKTRTLAATLTEQLRLILAPSLATKLRGDFRTGKRLNIKRIIPYIASSYKRDKIWMRRSVPSKRAYQIMIAVDDSKSMAEHGKKELAHETLALVTRALSMLEVGELCVTGFGEDVQIAHPFDKPFTDDAGVDIFSRLSFDQGDTDVRKLVATGIDIFQNARAKASSSAQDLWQLMLIVSDAICRDADSIKRLVRQAQEEKIMLVFVVVDAGAKEVDGRQVGSIMDLQGAEFQDGQVKMYRYMDVFPFKWWVVVQDVRELPGVLSMALRQWFSEVADTGS